MKINISQRKEVQTPSREITLTKKRGLTDGEPGPNEIAKWKKMKRNRGIPCTQPGLGKKAGLSEIRKVGDIPAIVYAAGHQNERISIRGGDTSDSKGFHAVMRDIKRSGFLATTIFELDDGKTVRKAIIKDLMYNKISYDVEHIDFLLLDGDKPVTLNIPVEVVGIPECKGIKAGGFLRQVIRALKVTCAPSQIPKSIVVDIKDLEMPVAKAPDAVLTGPRPVTSKTVADLGIAKELKVLVPGNKIVAMIAKK